MLICPKCNSDQVRMEPIMRGSQHHDVGITNATPEPLIYWRCATCRSIFSRLTAPTIILAMEELGYFPRGMKDDDYIPELI